MLPPWPLIPPGGIAGGRGLGWAIVKRLAEAGCDIAVVDMVEENAKSVAEEVKATGRRTINLKVDVTQLDQVQYMVKDAIDQPGGPGIKDGDAA